MAIGERGRGKNQSRSVNIDRIAGYLFFFHKSLIEITIVFRLYTESLAERLKMYLSIRVLNLNIGIYSK